jgi:hypothetical protein
MIRHIVMWKLRGDTPLERENTRRLVKEAVERMRGAIPGLLDLELGIDVSGVDYACDVVLVADFESHDALTHYAAHPAHLRMREELGDVRTARFQVDYARSMPSPEYTETAHDAS